MRPAWRRFAKIIIVLFGVILAYQILLYPATVQYILEKTVPMVTRSRLHIDVRRSSLLHGFHFQDIQLNTENGDPIVSIPELKLTWFLPGILAGHVGIRGPYIAIATSVRQTRSFGPSLPGRLVEVHLSCRGKRWKLWWCVNGELCEALDPRYLGARAGCRVSH